MAKTPKQEEFERFIKELAEKYSLQSSVSFGAFDNDELIVVTFSADVDDTMIEVFSVMIKYSHLDFYTGIIESCLRNRVTALHELFKSRWWKLVALKIAHGRI